MNPFLTLLLRDLRLAGRSGGSAALALAFFALVATLVPLGIGADLKLLARVAGGVLWVGAVLAALLSLDRLFQGDYEDGSLEVIALSPLPLELTSLAKILAHWLSTGLPLTLLSPLLALLFNLPGAGTAGAVHFPVDRHPRRQRGRRHWRQPDPVPETGRIDPATDHSAAAGPGGDFRGWRRGGDPGSPVQRRPGPAGGFLGRRGPAVALRRGRLCAA